MLVVDHYCVKPPAEVRSSFAQEKRDSLTTATNLSYVSVGVSLLIMLVMQVYSGSVSPTMGLVLFIVAAQAVVKVWNLVMN